MPAHLRYSTVLYNKIQVMLSISSHHRLILIFLPVQRNDRRLPRLPVPHFLLVPVAWLTLELNHEERFGIAHLASSDLVFQPEHGSGKPVA